MGKHEEKICGRCGAAFECRVGDIIRCQCFGIALPPAVQEWAGRQYSDCLCRACLLKLQQTELPQQNDTA